MNILFASTKEKPEFWVPLLRKLLPEDRFEGVQRERPESVESSRGPEQDWFAAIRGGRMVIVTDDETRQRLQSVARYAADVRAGAFPTERESFKMDPASLAELRPASSDAIHRRHALGLDS